MSKKKKLSKDKYRIIKIGEEALWEFIYESVIENQGDFFDIKDVTKITSHHEIDFEKGEYICLINKNKESGLKLPEQINLRKLLKNMEDTTTTLFQSNRYIDLSIEDIEAIQSKDSQVE